MIQALATPVLLLLLALGAPVRGAPPEPAAPASRTAPEPAVLDLQSAVTQAVHWHPVLRNARGQLLQAGEGIDGARAGYYPRVRAGISSRASNQSAANEGGRNQQRAELALSQMLYDFGKVGSQVEQARARSGAARAQVLLSFDQVARSTTEAWVEVRRNKALTGVAEQQLDAIRALAALARERETRGGGTFSDTAQAAARVDAAQLSLQTAQSQVQLWRTTLHHWVGGNAVPDAAGTVPAGLAQACRSVDTTALAQGAMDSTGAVAAVQVAQAQLEAARAGQNLAQAQRLPTLSVDGSVGRRLGGAGGSDARGVDAAILLNFSMPLYEGGQLRADERAAGYAVDSARAALDQTRLNASLGLQNAVLQWQKFSGRTPAQAARAENMRVTRALYREQYLQLGTRSLLDLLNAEQEYYGALNDQIETEHELIRQNTECLFHSGHLRAAFGLDQAVAQTLDPVDLPRGTP